MSLTTSAVLQRRLSTVNPGTAGGPPAPAAAPPRRAPKAADPDRVVGIALLELHPDPGAGQRHPERPSGSPPPARRASPSSTASRSRRPGRCTGSGRSASGRRCSRPCRGTCRGSSCRLMRPPWAGREEPVARQREVLRIFASLDVVRDALHVVQAVERRAGAAHADELPRLQHPPVAEDVERSRRGDRVGARAALASPMRRRGPARTSRFPRSSPSSFGIGCMIPSGGLSGVTSGIGIGIGDFVSWFWIRTTAGPPFAVVVELKRLQVAWRCGVQGERRLRRADPPPAPSRPCSRPASDRARGRRRSRPRRRGC